MAVGVILYGPPASGKDTVTSALVEIDPRFEHYQRIKAGSGSTRGYRMAERAEVDHLRSRHEVIWSNERYGATYVIDRARLVEQLARAIPIVHVGQAEAVAAVAKSTQGTAWIVTALWCPRDVAERRIRERGDADAAARLTVWDETTDLRPPVTTINTAVHQPADVARLIAAAVHDAEHPYVS